MAQHPPRPPAPQHNYPQPQVPVGGPSGPSGGGGVGAASNGTSDDGDSASASSSSAAAGPSSAVPAEAQQGSLPGLPGLPTEPESPLSPPIPQQPPQSAEPAQSQSQAEQPQAPASPGNHPFLQQDPQHPSHPPRHHYQQHQQHQHPPQHLHLHHPHHQIFATPAAASAFRSLSHTSSFDEADDERSAPSDSPTRPTQELPQELPQELTDSTLAPELPSELPPELPQPSARAQPILLSSSSSSDSDYLHPSRHVGAPLGRPPSQRLPGQRPPGSPIRDRIRPCSDEAGPVRLYSDEAGPARPRIHPYPEAGPVQPYCEPVYPPYRDEPVATTTTTTTMGPPDHLDEDDNEGDRHPLQAAHGRLEAAEPPATYPGEDTRPTSPKEILGWYMYAFASETYVICAMASFVPILLESLARENGVLLSDRMTPCTASNAHTSDDSQCIVYVLGIEVNTASFAMYTFSISVLLQALLVVSISCAADHGHHRKTLLLGFAWAGSFSVMLYLAVSARVYLLGALLAIVSNTSFGASFVLLNSFLPLLVRHHPSVLFGQRSRVPGLDSASASPSAVEPELTDADSSEGPGGTAEQGESTDPSAEESMEPDPADDPTTALLHRHRNEQTRPRHGNASPSDPSPSPAPAARRSHEEQTSVELTLSTQISSKGIGIGYCAALFVQCIAILIVFRMHNTVWSQRVVLFGIGVWWAVFTIPAAMWLRPRPGPPLPATAAGVPLAALAGRPSLLNQARAWLAYLTYSWKSLFRTISYARRLLDIVLFLAGWFLLSDAIATTSSTAVLFAKTQLRMEVWALGMINMISTLTGVIGAFSWAYVSRRFGLKPLHTILACLALFELIPLYGLMGYLPFVRAWGVFGLQQPWEMYPLAAVYGLVLGGLSAYCRSLYGELVPPGSEAAFYALYAITDKGSSVFGPAIVGAIIDASGEIRPAFWFLAALVGLPAPLLYFVDVERGKREGERLAAVIEGFRPGAAAAGAGAAAPGEGGHRRHGNGVDDTDSSHTPRAILADYSDEDGPSSVQSQ